MNIQLKGDEYDFDPGLPSDRPSALLFIDRSSKSLKISRKSKESLTVFRELASHNHIPFKKNVQTVVKPQKPFMEGHASRTVPRHPKLELSTSSQKVTVLEDKITIMAFEDGKQITINDVASNLQGNSLQEVLEYVLQQKKQRKLSSLAKDVGFQLLSDDIDITVSEKDVKSDDKVAEPSKKGLMGSSADFQKDQVSHVGDDEKISVNTSAQFFFVDGQFRLLETLTGALKIPSLVIIDPISHQHYVYPEEADFSNSSLSGFLHMFLNGSLVPYVRSKSVVPDSKESPHPPFVNQDFHEADSIPCISGPTFRELVVGNHSCSFSADNAWKKDVLVLFTSSWCGFCLRTELVVREIYRAFKGYDNIVRSQYRNEEYLSKNGKSLSTGRWRLHFYLVKLPACCRLFLLPFISIYLFLNFFTIIFLSKVRYVADGINNTILKLPMIYMMDCTENDCSLLLKSSTKVLVHPLVLLYCKYLYA